MRQETKSLVPVVTVVAALFALAVTILLPAGYFLYERQVLSGELSSESQATAAFFSRELVRQQITHLNAGLLSELVEEDLTETEFPEIRHFLDLDGTIRASSVETLAAPTLAARAEVVVNDATAGYLEVRRSIRSLVNETAILSLASIALGVLLFYVLRTVPLRALQRTMDELSIEKSRASVTLGAIGDAVISLDNRGVVNYVNSAAQQLLARPASEVIGQPLSAALTLSLDTAPATARTCREDIWTCLIQYASGRHNLGATVTDGHGRERAVECTLSPILENHERRGWVLAARDITEKRQAEQQLVVMANYDSLTGLPNRALFRDRLQHAMHRTKRVERLLALLFLDLDRFKIINDTLGHATGDELLKQVAHRLQNTLRTSDTVARNDAFAEQSDHTVARLGGDEFTIILEDIHHVDQVVLVANRLLQALQQPFVLNGHELHVTTSIGITIYPMSDTHIDELIRHADAAMYRAKDIGRNTFQFYSNDINAQMQERLAIEAQLRKGLEDNRFEVYFQPKSTMDQTDITGYEALLRFYDDDGQLLLPDEFIPLLEDTGLIIEVGDWVIDRVCRQIAHWQQRHRTDARVAVNLSARQLEQRNFVEKTLTALRRHAVPGDCLELEITESLLMDKHADTLEQLNRLRAKGIHISIDDFGTGYSSLSYLSRMPIDTLKIDRSFVRDIANSEETASIVKAIIQLAHSLRLTVVAEGVETPQDLDFLNRNGCDQFQGFWLAKPMPLLELEDWLEERITPTSAACPTS